MAVDRAAPVAEVTGGVDTRKAVHLAAAVGETGRLLGAAAFPTTAAGYRRLLAWLRSFGRLGRVGSEGTGSYGAGLGRCLHAAGVEVVEVNRPDRQGRRRRGKSEPADAEAAARSALAGQAAGRPKRQDGTVEAIRLLRLARRAAVKARTQAAHQLPAIVDTAPDELRRALPGRRVAALVPTARRFRGGRPATPLEAATIARQARAERWATLAAELQHLDAQLAALVAVAGPGLLDLPGVGTATAGALPVAAGDNPERLASEASFAALCGVTPVDASSGRQKRHRLHRGGNRDADRARWVVAMVRMAKARRTRASVARRTAEGLTKRAIVRGRQRSVAREVHKALRAARPPDTSAPGRAAA